MGFTGSGSFIFDNKYGSLEYATQEILQTRDDRVYSELHLASNMFNDVRQTISGWGSSAMRYYDKDTQIQSNILSELSNLTGTISNLPSVIAGQTNSVLVPVSKIETQISEISKVLPDIYTSMEGSRSSIQGLYDTARDIYAKLGDISNLGDLKGPESAPPPVLDYTPDYSDALNDISDIIGSIRDSISGFDGKVDASTLYPGLHSDLSNIKDVIGELANLYTTAEGFDVAGFTNAIQDFVGEFALGMTDSLTNVLVPEIQESYANFVSEFVDSFTNEFDKYNDSLMRVLPVRPENISGPELTGAVVGVSGQFADSVNNHLKSIDDTQKQFQFDTIVWLENIDGRLSKSFTNLNTTVTRAGKSSDKFNLGDVIDSFEDAEESSISMGGNVSSILNWLRESRITEYLSTLVGLFTFANIAEQMDTIHNDVRSILQATGGTRGQAVDLRGAINRNIFDTYGMGTFTQAERVQALNDALRSGAVSQRHLEQATEVSLAYNKLLGTTIDFSQGWAKSLMVTKTNADEYLEAVAISIDDFSNNFFASAETLQKAAENYANTARVFSTDMKSFSKSINKAIQLQAAQEEANIQSMDIAEWIDHISKTAVWNWTDADYMRANAYGISNPYEFSDMTRWDPKEAARIVGEGALKQARQARVNLQQGGIAAQATLGTAQDFYNYTDGIALGADVENLELFLKDLSRTDITKAGDISSLKDRAAEVANNNNLEQLTNIANALRDDPDSFPGKIFAQLEKLGVSSMAGGILGGIIKGVFTYFTGKLIGKAITGALGKSFGGSLAEAAGTAGLAGVFGKFTGAMKGFTGKIGSFASNLGPNLKNVVTGFGSKIKDFAVNFPNKFKDLIKNPGKLATGTMVAKTIWDVGAGADKSVDWAGGDDYESKIASGIGGALGGASSGIGSAISGAIKWGAIGTAIAPGIGTAIGAALGGVAGAFGGEKIAKTFKSITDKAGELNDTADLWMEEHLGIVGHAVGSLKDSFIDINKSIYGAIATGLGDFVGGLKSGGSKIIHGDILGGLGDMASGLFTGVKNLLKGPFDAIKSVWEDWTMSAKDRIEKRKGELKDLSKEAEDAQKDTDKKIDGIKPSDVTKEPAFKYTGEGRKGMSDVSGLNRYAFADSSASKLLDNNTPIEHVPGEIRTAADFGISEADLMAFDQERLANQDVSVAPESSQVAMETPVISEISNTTDLTRENKPVIYGSKEYEEITNKPKTRESVDLAAGAVGETDLASEVSTETLEEKQIDLAQATVENTLAIQALTAAIQQAYGITPEIPEGIEQLSKTVGANFTDEDYRRLKAMGISNTEGLTETTSNISRPLEKLTGDLSGFLSSGFLGMGGVLTGKLLDNVTGRETSQPEPPEGLAGQIGYTVSNVLKTGLYGPTGVLAGNILGNLVSGQENQDTEGALNSSEFESNFNSIVSAGTAAFEGIDVNGMLNSLLNSGKVQAENEAEGDQSMPTAGGIQAQSSLAMLQQGLMEMNAEKFSFLSGLGDIAEGAMNSGVFGLGGLIAGKVTEGLRSVGSEGLTSIMQGQTRIPMVDNELKGPIINNETKFGPENISSPIVSSLNSNMSSVIGLLERIAASQNKTEPKQNNYPTLPPTPSVNTTNDNGILNYHSIIQA